MFEILGKIVKIHPTKIVNQFFKVTNFDIEYVSLGRRARPQVRIIQGHRNVQRALEEGEYKVGDVVIIKGELKGHVREKDNRVINVDEAYEIRRA